MSNPSIDPRIQAVLDVPVHRFVGISLIDPSDPAAGTTFTVAEPSQGPGGWLHGGVVSALLDMTCYVTLLPRLPQDRIAVSHAVNISLLKGVPGGSTVQLKAEVLRLGKSLAFMRAEAHSDGHLVAAATITKSIIPG